MRSGPILPKKEAAPSLKFMIVKSELNLDICFNIIDRIKEGQNLNMFWPSFVKSNVVSKFQLASNAKTDF